jgi:3-oxoacyl-[acyl-carrier protein] reductase
MTAVLPRRRALVTGAARNIGRATALQLARQGFDVVVHTRQDDVAAAAVVSEVEALGVRGDVVMADLTDADAVRRMAGGIGRVDVLINNAALRPHRPFLEIDSNEWRSVFAITVDAAFVLAQAVLPGMQERRWGRIVSMTGVRAHMGAPGRASSSAAKHALVGLTRSLANEFGGFGITANIVCPGTIMSDADAADGQPAVDDRERGGALRRFGRADEIAAVVGFLTSDAAGYVTGQTVGANGGELMI